MSSGTVGPRSSTNLEIRSRPSNDVSSTTWLAAALRHWADTSRYVISADTGRSPTTRVATVIVPSAKDRLRPDGWTPERRSCCPSSTSTWSSRSRKQSVPVALQNPRVVYGILFRAAAETLLQIAADPEHLGAEIGILAVLHTWGQNLQHHPHVHCVIPGGGLSPDGSQWTACRPGFFLPVRVLSRVFRGKFLALLRKAFDRGRLRFHGKLSELSDSRQFQHQLAASVKTDWVVYAKPPFGGPAQVLRYLARYTHRVAISNRRLIALEDGKVRFLWKDYAQGGCEKTMTLDASEFLRRFLLHVLPSGFVRIRHYGFLSNRLRHEKVAVCRTLLSGVSVPECPAAAPSVEPIVSDVELLSTGACPRCGKGRMFVVEELPPIRVDPNNLERIGGHPMFDTS